VATPLLAIGSFFLWQQYNMLKSQSQKDVIVEAKLAGHTIDEWLKEQREAAHALAISINLFKADSPQRLMANALHSHPGWSEVFLVDPKGKLLTYVANHKAKTQANTQLPLTSFGEILLKKQSKISGYTTSPLSGRPALLLNVPIHQSDRLKEILIVAIDPGILLTLFHDLDERLSPVVTVIDASKKVITRSLHNEIWEGQDTSVPPANESPEDRAWDTSSPGIGITNGAFGTYALEAVSDSGWLVAVAEPKSSALNGAHTWLMLMLLLALSALGVSLLLAFLATSHFTKNINVFVKEAFAIGQGDLSRRVNVKASDELGTLANAFNQMASKLEIDQEQKFLVERLAEAIRQSLDLDQILDTTVRELGRTLQASRCCLALLDDRESNNGSERQLVFEHVWYDSEHGGSPLNNRSLVVVNNSVLEMILTQGSILSLDLLEEGAGPSPLFQNKNGSPDDWKSIRSLIACPIVANNSSKGLILVHQCNQLRTWSDAELELVQTTARQVTLAMQHAQLYSRTKMMAEQEMLINHIVRSVRSSLDLNTILNTATEELAKALGVSRCQIAQPNKSGPLVVTHEFHTPDLSSTQGISLYSEPLNFHPAAGEPPRPGRNLVLGIDLNKITGSWELPSKGGDNQTRAITLKEAPIAIINDVNQDSRTLPFKQFLDQVQSKSLIAAPLLSEQQLVGLLIVHQCDQLRTWKSSEIQLVQAIADQLAIAITHAHLFAQIRYQAITDGLTGLYNHVYFKHRLAEEIRLADRKGMPCSLLMIDLDNLKQINDHFGHPVGDQAIRHVAGILKTLLRSGDTAARYGGEEFVVILPETSLLEAGLIGNRLCSQIANAQVPGLGRITASIGAASYPRQANDIDDLIGKADKALYCAKGAGRNQIWIFEEPGRPVPEFRVPQRLLAAKNRSANDEA
jgi:diguanylate cyclase (GGDEF)-like protein